MPQERIMPHHVWWPERLARARAAAAGLAGPEVNHDLPDLALIANLVAGLPEDRAQPGRIELEADLVNIGATAAHDAEVVLLAGCGAQLAGPVAAGTIPPCGSATVRLVFEHDGSFLTATLAARSSLVRLRWKFWWRRERPAG